MVTQTRSQFVLHSAIFVINCMMCFHSAFGQSNTTPVQPASHRNRISNNAEFQVRVDIYTEDSKPPINSLQTIFVNSMAIEFDDQKGRYTIVDSQKQRVSILDRDRKVLVHLDMHAIDTQLDRAMQLMSAEQQVAFASDGAPVREADDYFSIGNANIRYRFRPIATSPEIASSYAEFSDWVTRIYALHGPRMPPQIRLDLNKLLATQSQVPGELRRTIVYGGKSERPVREEIIARMNITSSLSDNDKGRVASVYKWMQEFKPVTESSFFK